MSILKPKHVDRLKKVYQLALHGVGGEKLVAKELLDVLLAKHGFCIDDILDEEKIRACRFRYHTEYDKKLLIQVMAKVTDSGVYKVWRKKLLITDCTPAQQVEIDFLYHVYRKELEQELKRTVRAFVQVNEIFGDGVSEEELNPEELLELRLMFRRASSMSSVRVRKEISD